MGMFISHSTEKSSIMENEAVPETNIEGIALGSTRVGKTSLLHYVAGLPDPPMYVSTIGIEPRKIVINSTQINMWDTAGITDLCTDPSEPYSLYDYLIKRCSLFIVMFSVTDRASWHKVCSICIRIEHKAEHRIMFLLVGTKLDARAPIVVGALEIEALQMRYHGMEYIMVNSKEEYDKVDLQLEMMLP